MKRSPPNSTKALTGKRLKLSIIIPSPPAAGSALPVGMQKMLVEGRDSKVVIENLREIKPPGIDFQILAVKGKWLPTQRNLAIKKAHGDFIFLFDDDIIIPRGSIEAALKTFGAHADEGASTIQVVGGPNITPPHDSFLQHCFGFAHASFFTGAGTAVRYYPAKNIRQVTENQLITCNLAFRAEVLKRNLFDPEICPNEENDLLGRIREEGRSRSGAGGPLAYNKNFFVYHHRRDKLKKYLHQIFKWGEGRTLHSIKRPQHFSAVFLVPVAFLFYLISLVWPGSTWLSLVGTSTFLPQNSWPLASLWYLAPLWLYLLLDLIFSLQVVFAYHKPAAVFVMPWLFPFTHISYALGTLYGLKHFFIKPGRHPAESDHQLTEINL